MNKKLKAKWLVALRSGDYQQGKCTLKDREGRYCCYGVLAHILPQAIKEEFRIEELPTEISIDISGFYGKCYNTLPRKLLDRIGLMAMGEPMHMNDDGKPFSAIADYIEQNF